MVSPTLLSRLRELTALPGPSGHEREVALVFAKHLRAYTDDVVLDPFGNVIATTSLMGTAYHRALFRRLQDVAEAAAIPHQLDVARTWTDACGTSVAGHGVPTGGIYMARRNAHSPCEVAKLSDVEGAARLVTAFLADLTGREVQELGSVTRL